MSPRQLAILSLVRRKAATVITVIAIAISVACSGLLLRLYHLQASRFASLGKGFAAVVGAKAGGIEILLNALNAEGPYPDFLPSVLYDSLRAAQPVHFEDGADSNPNYIKSVTPFLYFAKLHQSRALGTDEVLTTTVGGLSDGHWASQMGEIVAGSMVAKREKLHAGDPVMLQPWIVDHLGGFTVAFKVSGILNETGQIWDQMLYTNIAQAQNILAQNRSLIRERSIWGERVLNYFLINLQPGGFLPLQNLINKRTVGQTILVDTETAKLEELTGSGKNIGFFVSILVIALSSLSVSAMLITRFEAMSVQLAVLRAIGYPKSTISGWLIWEGILLGMAGCLVGAALDASLFPSLRQVLGTALPPPEQVKSTILESYPIWLVTIPATAAAVFVPLIRLYRQDVHSALKG